MCAAVAGLILFKRRPPTDQGVNTPTVVETTPTPAPATSLPPAPAPLTNRNSIANIDPQPPSIKPLVPAASQFQTGLLARATAIPVMTNDPTAEPEAKPLPVLEKEYGATTNRDTRLDIMMDIADWPGPDAVRALARLFEIETDPDLKVDLLDSLLGIEGQVEEKLKMLTAGTQKGLPTDVRQSAIDGLIDLDDQRVIPVFNGLLNDPDEEIREGAKDALEMMQSKPAVKLK